MASHPVSVVAKQTPTCHQHTVAVDLRTIPCTRYIDVHSAYLVHRLLSPTSFRTVQVLAQLKQLLTITPRRNNKPGMRFHSLVADGRGSAVECFKACDWLADALQM
jgi:hypothetical protein